uniref:Uncharacterized protein n=1 Tax=Rhizophora mucronata TaxID=61149 RepID=A0A2P2NU57_RHIMU
MIILLNQYLLDSELLLETEA